MRNSLVILAIFLSAGAFSQILPGMAREDILMHMSESYGDFVLTEPPNAGELEFIKYEHRSGDKTLLVFMPENGNCTFTRLIADKLYMKDTISEFNEKYKSEGENRWTATRGEERFIVHLSVSEWMFTVTVRKPDYIK
jgi:hypothetical protein